MSSRLALPKKFRIRQGPDVEADAPAAKLRENPTAEGQNFAIADLRRQGDDVARIVVVAGLVWMTFARVV